MFGVRKGQMVITRGDTAVLNVEPRGNMAPTEADRMIFTVAEMPEGRIVISKIITPGENGVCAVAFSSADTENLPKGRRHREYTYAIRYALGAEESGGKIISYREMITPEPPGRFIVLEANGFPEGVPCVKDDRMEIDLASFRGPQGEPGETGPTGPQGPKGEKGDKGERGKDAAIDATLTQAGQAADAKQVGDEMRVIHEKLDEKADKVHQNILIGSKSGASVSVSDAFAAPLCGLNIYGRSKQDGTPSPDNPVPIVSAGSKGTLAVKIMNKNLFNYLAPPDEDKGWYGGECAIEEDILTVTAKHGWHVYWYKNPAPKKTTTVSLAYRQKDSTTSGNTYHSFAIVKSDDKSYPTKGDQYIVDEPEPATEWKKVTGTVEPSEYIGIFICLQNENAEEYREIEIRDMQIELGSTATEYEPYCEKNLILQTPDGIRGIQTLTNGNYTDEAGQKWICDEIDLERGVKIQRIGRAKLNRVTTTVDPQWYDSDQSYSYEITLFDDYKFYDSYAEPNEGYDLCDHFQTYSFSDFYRKNIETGLLAGHSYVVVNISKSLNIGATVDDFKTWFNENVILYKRLQTPIETPLTDEEIAAYKALVAYAPNTTVQVEDGAEIKLNYQRDVNIAIRTLEDAIASMTTN